MSNREIPQVVKNLQKARARMAMHGMARYQFINEIGRASCRERVFRAG